MFSPHSKRISRLIFQYRKERDARKNGHIVRKEKRVNSFKGAQARKRGNDAERVFFNILSSIQSPPAWFLGVRKADLIEDANGYDAFILTQTGEIPIQIKRSSAGAKNFRKKRPMHPALIIVINPKREKNSLKEFILQSITTAYNLLILDTSCF